MFKSMWIRDDRCLPCRHPNELNSVINQPKSPTPCAARIETPGSVQPSNTPPSVPHPQKPNSRSAIRAALPATAVLAGAATHGQIVYTDIPDTTISTSGPNTELYFGVGNGLGSSGYVATTGPGDARVYFDSGNAAKPRIAWPSTPSNFSQLGAYNSGGTVYMNRYSAGDPIGSALSWVGYTDAFLNRNGGNNTYWQTGTRGYMAFAISPLTTPEDDRFYGWADVSYNSDSSFTIYGFAYEQQNGVAILAGSTSSIPEPSTYAVMAGLLAGSAALYKRRRDRKAAAAT